MIVMMAPVSWSAPTSFKVPLAINAPAASVSPCRIIDRMMSRFVWFINKPFESVEPAGTPNRKFRGNRCRCLSMLVSVKVMLSITTCQQPESI